MKDKKVVPIGGRHRSFSSLASEAANDRPEWKRGIIVGFEDDGTMNFGEFGLECSDVGMVQMYLQMLAMEFMK